MKNRIFILFISIFALLNCGKKQNNIVHFNSVTKECEFVIHNSDLTKNIFAIKLVFQGEINNDAVIIIGDGINYKKTYKIDKGQVDYIIDTDWYSPKCFIEYYPENITNGNLCVIYHFFEML